MTRTIARLSSLFATGALAAALMASAASAQTPATGSRRPSLVVTIVVDQFSSNLFNQYRDRFTGGLHTLATHGLVYANGFQQHAMTETCPGHATVLTGVNPAGAARQ